MANEERGEIALDLDGTSYPLRPSFQAIQAAEAGTGRSLRALAQATQAGELTLAELGVVALAMIKAGASDDANVARFKADRIAELIYETGAAKVSMVLFALLIGALTGGVTASGEAKAAVETGTITVA